MTELERCINFWEGMLEHNRFAMSMPPITQIENTIKCLKELQEIKQLQQI